MAKILCGVKRDILKYAEKRRKEKKTQTREITQEPKPKKKTQEEKRKQTQNKHTNTKQTQNTHKNTHTHHALFLNWHERIKVIDKYRFFLTFRVESLALKWSYCSREGPTHRFTVFGETCGSRIGGLEFSCESKGSICLDVEDVSYWSGQHMTFDSNNWSDPDVSINPYNKLWIWIVPRQCRLSAWSDRISKSIIFMSDGEFLHGSSKFTVWDEIFISHLTTAQIYHDEYAVGLPLVEHSSKVFDQRINFLRMQLLTLLIVSFRDGFLKT